MSMLKANYQHRLVIGKNQHAIIIKLLWQHQHDSDDIIVNVRVYNHEIAEPEIDFAEVIDQFALLGI